MNPTRNQPVIFTLICLLAATAGACSSRATPTALPVTQPVAQATLTLPPLPQTDTPIPTHTPTFLPSPTATPIPSPTATETPTPSATPIPLAVVAFNGAVVRTGPGTVYPALAIMAEGTTFQVLGRNEEATWLLLDLTLDQSGWVAAQSLFTDLEMQTLSAVAAPPTPEPTPTPAVFPQLTFWQKEGVMFVDVLNFQEGEYVTVVVINTQSGKTEQTIVIRRFTANINYRLHLSIYLPTGVKFLVVATGDQGSVARGTFTAP